MQNKTAQFFCLNPNNLDFLKILEGNPNPVPGDPTQDPIMNFWLYTVSYNYFGNISGPTTVDLKPDRTTALKLNDPNIYHTGMPVPDPKFFKLAPDGTILYTEGNLNLLYAYFFATGSFHVLKEIFLFLLEPKSSEMRKYAEEVFLKVQREFKEEIKRTGFQCPAFQDLELDPDYLIWNLSLESDQTLNSESVSDPEIPENSNPETSDTIPKKAIDLFNELIKEKLGKLQISDEKKKKSRGKKK